MKYILSQEEYDALLNTKKDEIKLGKAKLQKLCTTIADTMPIKLSWGQWKETPTPWGCMLTEESKGEEWYCDSCPVDEICPCSHKHWSQ